MNCYLHAAPLQGLTDYRFRKVYTEIFKGIDYFYAPYIRLNTKKEIKKANIRDINSENNYGYNLIPQVLTNNPEDFLMVAKYIEKTGYRELNWNLGCPYPMVTNKGMGAGMLNDLHGIKDILARVFEASNIDISIKMRLGNADKTSILKLLPVLNNYQIKNIIIHPRIGKQLYKGKLDLDTFENCLALTRHQIVFNGDIKTIGDFKILRDRFPQITQWMIGRGLIADPFLAEMIKENRDNYPINRYNLLRKMHDLLLYEYEKALSGEAHIIMKMTEFWRYWSYNFTEQNKKLKKIKKAKSLSRYNQAVRELFETI